jgi:hypothetical protein
MATEAKRERGTGTTVQNGGERAPRASTVAIAAGATGVTTADTTNSDI